MKLSVIIVTRNRAHAIVECLNSVAVAIEDAAPLDAEIVVVDNGSTDDTFARITAWANACNVSVQLLSEPGPGLARAQNAALRAARGGLFVFTDDDCQLTKSYIRNLLHYDAADTTLVLRGGRIELGDSTDLPLTINNNPNLIRWTQNSDPARHALLGGHIHGCNMTMRRALVERLGPLNEDFGPGTRFESGSDADYIYRAYLAGATLEYVPDMTVLHYHGRKTIADGRNLLRRYMKGAGALYARYLFKDPKICRRFYWDCKNALKEIITGTNTFMPSIDFSHKDKVVYSICGAAKYFLACARELRPRSFGTWRGPNDL
jgi:GT2 family glycosyltransferase